LIHRIQSETNEKLRLLNTNFKAENENEVNNLTKEILLGYFVYSVLNSDCWNLSEQDYLLLQMEESKVQPLTKVVDILMDYWKKKRKKK
jgi:hypothetical protein